MNKSLFIAKYRSQCPKCGNTNVLSEKETKEPVHCQTCYHHYDYNENPHYRGI